MPPSAGAKDECILNRLLERLQVAALLRKQLPALDELQKSLVKKQ
jgi:hypothetical protein